MSHRGDDPAARLLELVGHEPGLSIARAAKRLGLGQSQLRRLLTHLGPEGAGLVTTDPFDRVTRLELTAAAQSLLCAPAGVVQVPARREEAGRCAEHVEWLVEEAAVALLYNGVAHAVMLATPVDLRDFAIGFTLSEGIVDDPDQIEWIELHQSAAGLSVHLGIPSADFERLADRQRGLSGRSGCGLCGTTALAAAIRPPRQLGPVEWARKPDPATLPAAFLELRQLQRLHTLSGAVHAAAAVDGDGKILAVREDIGRHNALDKVLGACALAGSAVGGVLLTSRSSYELVHKAAQCGVPLLASVSGPSALAVKVAQQAGVQLLGFVREQRYTHYAGPALAEAVRGAG